MVFGVLFSLFLVVVHSILLRILVYLLGILVYHTQAVVLFTEHKDNGH
jgi:hypothetical protein